MRKGSVRWQRASAKVALMLASPAARACVLRRDLYVRTGSLALSAGLFRPRLYIDPRLAGEHRWVQQFVRCHEGAHLALDHPRYIELIRYAAISLAAGCTTLCALPFRSEALLFVAGFVGAWLEARFGLLSLYFRAGFEKEADALALDVIAPIEFASAIKTMERNKPPMSGYARFVDGVLNGKTWQDRLRRVGVDVPGEMLTPPRPRLRTRIRRRALILWCRLRAA